VNSAAINMDVQVRPKVLDEVLLLTVLLCSVTMKSTKELKEMYCLGWVCLYTAVVPATWKGEAGGSCELMSSTQA
jgi:hypothetical protein